MDNPTFPSNINEIPYITFLSIKNSRMSIDKKNNTLSHKVHSQPYGYSPNVPSKTTIFKNVVHPRHSLAICSLSGKKLFEELGVDYV